MMGSVSMPVLFLLFWAAWTTGGLVGYFLRFTTDAKRWSDVRADEALWSMLPESSRVKAELREKLDERIADLLARRR